MTWWRTSHNPHKAVLTAICKKRKKKSWCKDVLSWYGISQFYSAIKSAKSNALKWYHMVTGVLTFSLWDILEMESQNRFLGKNNISCFYSTRFLFLIQYFVYLHHKFTISFSFYLGCAKKKRTSFYILNISSIY